ncbi:MULTISPECIES: GNAT family N-acetyltransferase [Streptacidiphilus]|uniref:GNAT family N-acetyltransferase n=1 Tax=Streptacidiphilus cavernicola TaxID=3342716 RepID=A0ABV6UQ58_9ACTN|nr:GNAT family N-acetyltransferase [Streptacidiphilus jeojiense]
MTINLSAVPGLTLRPWRAEDLPSLVAAHQDPMMQRFLDNRVAGMAEARVWLAAQEAGWTDGTRCSFAVIEDVRAEAGPIGHVVVKRLGLAGPGGSGGSGGDGTASGPAEIGYWTATGVRGRGIAPAAVSAVAEWALRQVPRLQLLHSVENHASCRVAEKSGFAFADHLPAHPPRFPDEGHRHVRESTI